MANQLSPDQKAALEQLYAWCKAPRSTHISVGGYAGVGKTTLLAVFRKLLFANNPKLKVAFCSFTGRATRVLQQRLKLGNAVFSKDNISTIHGLIYQPIINSRHQISGWKLKEELPYDLIILDEASMVSEAIWRDLLGFGKPVVAVGDHGQLPPIEGTFNLMTSPDIRLEKIHRQAEANPIIQVSMLARENGYIPPRNFSNQVIKIDRNEPESQETAESWLKKSGVGSLVLCGYNKTRLSLNQFIREDRGFDQPQPHNGDRVICLKNNQKQAIFNGMLGTIRKIKPGDELWYEAEILMDDESENYVGLLYRDQFGSSDQSFQHNPALREKGDFFDFGYALTVHKAQGSQAKRVVVFEERFPKMDDETWRRWLYTAVTRAEEELFMVGSGREL